MLEIIECKDKTKYQGIINGIDEKNVLVVESYDGDKVTGYGIYSYLRDSVKIYDFDDGKDINLCDGIIRSILFKACLKGIDNAVFEISDAEKISHLEALKFVKNGDKNLNNINDFMNNCKKCKEINKGVD